MCNVAVIEFFIDNVRKEEFEGKRVLEVGSKYINGSVRPLIEKFLKPKEYLGIDVEPGKYVDILLSAEKLLEYFGEESFDVVISTETLEHIKDWRLVINNIKSVVKSNGYIYLTTRSRGFPFHSYPYDFWRYEIKDMKKIFTDFEIIALERDHEAPGVFLKARKTEGWKPIDLSDIALYSITLGKRTKAISDISETPLARRIMFKLANTKFKYLAPAFIGRLLEKRFAR